MFEWTSWPAWIPWAVWAVMLILQQASHTATSRARNTKGIKGLWYNGVASIFSNGVWFGSQLFIVHSLVNTEDALSFLMTMAFYVFFCVIGSVGAHWYMMRWENKKGMIHG